ncbi:MAG: hypothetical protein L6Q97_27135, partial [Thermoanaerobaculia bacterium]|nr:hypothetical protein [Thermoanaerobaculia bacterium]
TIENLIFMRFINSFSLTMKRNYTARRQVFSMTQEGVKSLLLESRGKFFTTEARRHGVLFSMPPW